MVQVDLAWAYGLGSSFAVAAQTQLAEQTRLQWRVGFLTWPFLQLITVIITLLLTSTMHMLWAYPAWQTMYVADRNLRPWFIPLILVVITALAVLGFGVSLQLIRKKYNYLAFLQFAGGYFLLFLGMTYGWDGTGYQRTLSATREEFLNWKWSNAAAWANSEMAVIFYSYAIVLVPTLFILASYWIQKGRISAVSQLKIIAQLAFMIVGVLATSAVLMTMCLKSMGLVWGGLASLACGWILVDPRFGILRRVHRLIFDG